MDLGLAGARAGMGIGRAIARGPAEGAGSLPVARRGDLPEHVAGDIAAETIHIDGGMHRHA
ncbi:hypothetical protein ABT061_00020 [Streptosporangium sp. NPDC002544]|uniref:hypothetical protein n=1 Tax=Streptosporangium sp. NPDC002544 TaxID=3154538 RepID=UPI00332F6958